jgi:hypothetical protein
MKISLDVKNSELDALEDLITAWILCKKHNSGIINAMREEEIYEMQLNCKECQKLLKANRKLTLHLWSNLVHAYSIAKDGKCNCERVKK